MRYDMYLATTEEAARANGGRLEQLGAGYVGVKLTADGCDVMLVLDMDDEDGWACWREIDGSRCCDDCLIKLGYPRLSELGIAAYDAVLRHRCA